MTTTRIDLTRDDLATAIGSVNRTGRQLLGWSQRHLADVADTSQSTIWRLETGQPGPIDLVVTERVLTVLGPRGMLGFNDLALQDRQRQRDGLHAVLNGFVARRLVRHGWVAPTEVLVAEDRPRGWIDLLGYREADHALLVEETKCDLPDMGGLQRRLAFYVREARAVAEGLGWRPRRIAVLVVGLDTAAMAARLADNRDLVRQALPAPGDAPCVRRLRRRGQEAPPVLRRLPYESDRGCWRGAGARIRRSRAELRTKPPWTTRWRVTGRRSTGGSQPPRPEPTRRSPCGTASWRGP